jgi:hypothetical protein
MQTLPDFLRLLHEACNVRLIDHNVRTCNRLLLIQTPHVQFMHAHRTKDRLQIALDVFDLDAQRRGLEQYLSTALRQGYGRDQDHDGDPHADCRIGVEAVWRLDEPMNQVSVCLRYSTHMVFSHQIITADMMTPMLLMACSSGTNSVDVSHDVCTYATYITEDVE